MITVLGAVSVVLGVSAAYAATVVPAHLKLLESSGGALLVAGFALLGAALPYTP
jgi:hypothetical protein